MALFVVCVSCGWVGFFFLGRDRQDYDVSVQLKSASLYLIHNTASLISFYFFSDLDYLADELCYMLRQAILYSYLNNREKIKLFVICHLRRCCLISTFSTANVPTFMSPTKIDKVQQFHNL